MTNLMKHTTCKMCNQNLENLFWDNYQAHINRHLKDIETQKNQKSIEEYS